MLLHVTLPLHMAGPWTPPCPLSLLLSLQPFSWFHLSL
jgi:hypothetical protein